MHTRSYAAMALTIRITTAGLAVLTVAAHAEIQEAADGSAYIHVDDPRPLAKAATELSRRYGYGISYEDPTYLFSDDVQDVTQAVMKQPSASSTSKHRTLVPVGGTIDARLSQGRAEGREAAATGLREVLAARANSTYGGRFAVEETQGMLHIVPTEVRGKNGDWVRQSSLLSHTINIPAGARTGAEMLRMIAAEVARASGQPVELGMMPLNTLRNVSQFPAKRASAREVLVNLLQQSSPYLTWHLLYAPDLQRYYLSIVSFAKTNDASNASRGNSQSPLALSPTKACLVARASGSESARDERWHLRGDRVLSRPPRVSVPSPARTLSTLPFSFRNLRHPWSPIGIQVRAPELLASCSRTSRRAQGPSPDPLAMSRLGVICGFTHAIDDQCHRRGEPV